MAFASIGSLGTASTKTAGSALSMSPSSTVAVGRLLVVWSGYFATGAGFQACTDSRGNVYTRIGELSDQSRVVEIFVTRVTTQVETTDTITLTTVTALNEAKAMSAWEFSFTAGVRWATSDRWDFLASRAIDPGAISIGSLDSQEYLFLHGLCAQGPSTDAYTWDADYTQITTAGTTGGADSSNMTILGGFRIATLTGDTVNVSSDTADRSYCQVMCAVCENPYYDDFPSAPILDDFNRADENPLDNGTWDTGTGKPSFDGPLRIVSNVAASTGANGGGQWWLDSMEENDIEIYASIPTKPTTANGGISLVWHGTGSAQAANRQGYEATWTRKIASEVDDELEVGGAGNVDSIESHLTVSLPIVDGNKLGIQRRGKVNNCWVDRGSGWEWVTAIYATLDTYTSGKLGLSVYDDVERLDDFGGGPPAFLPQIYRRV